MDYASWTQRKFWLVIGSVLLAGMVISPKSVDTRVGDANQNVQTLASEAVSEVKAEGLKALRELDAIDQQIFEQSGEVIDAQSNALNIAGTILGSLESLTPADVDTATQMITEETQRIEAATAKVEQLQTERQRVLAD